MTACLESRILIPPIPLLKVLTYSPPCTHEAYFCRPFTRESLQLTLDELNDNKSCEIDNIPAEVLKYSGEAIKQYLLALYSKIFDEGKVPQNLNAVKCVLVHKSGDTLDMLNYRYQS